MAPRELSLATLGRSPALAETRKRLAQLAQAGAPLMLRGERGMRPELFARLLAAAGAPFVEGPGMMADEPSSEMLARAAGGILFVGDLAPLGRAEQKNLEFLLARSDKHKARVVSFSPLDRARWSRSTSSTPGCSRACPSWCSSCRRCAISPRTCPTSRR